MDLRSWPLSAAATRLLLDLHPDRPAATTNKHLAQLAVKELLWIGGLRVDEVRSHRWKPGLRVTTQEAATAAREPVSTLAARLPRADHYDLKGLVARAAERDRNLFRRDLRRATETALVQAGLAAPARRRAGGLLPRRYLALTPHGEVWQRSARAAEERAVAVAGRHADEISEVDDREVATLGALMLLAGDGLPAAAKVAASRRRRHESGVMPAGPAGPQDWAPSRCRKSRTPGRCWMGSWTRRGP